jgi:hypothetical protein
MDGLLYRPLHEQFRYRVGSFIESVLAERKELSRPAGNAPARLRADFESF